MPRDIRCPACGNGGTREFLNQQDSLYFPRRIVQCRGCGMMFVNPCPTDAELEKLYNEEIGALGSVEWDRKKKEYRRVNTGDAAPPNGKSPQGARAAYRAAYLRRLAPPPATLLDVGCRSGVFLSAAKDRGYESCGVEISREYAEVAAKQTGLDVFAGTLEELAEADPGARFDVITFWDVIEHLPDPASALKTMNSMQEPGGLVAISTPNLMNYRYFVYRNKWTGFREGPEHLLFFSARTLCALLEMCGYEPVRVATYQVPPLLLKWLNLFRLGHSLEVVARKKSSVL